MLQISHPTFEGVELKHIITAKDTDGHFSFHLVRIAAGKTIGNHRVISIIPAKIPHEVKAGNEGLYLFAKFIPALC
ncbi:MAG: hypothetical protein SOZ81_04135 [Agathobacter sp.]|nr:hypothetical protein [Agathobacter sp.]